jgi:hypothetical protein
MGEGMIEQESVTITSEPRGELYRALLGEALRHCDHFTVVQRSERQIGESAETLLLELSSHLRQERAVTEWPGTKLLGGTATLREYDLSEASAAILARAVEGLYDWCQPERPEDLIFWRASGAPWLVSIAHERDAYLEVTPAERDELLRTLPALATALEPSSA